MDEAVEYIQIGISVTPWISSVIIWNLSHGTVTELLPEKRGEAEVGVLGVEIGIHAENLYVSWHVNIVHVQAICSPVDARNTGCLIGSESVFSVQPVPGYHRDILNEWVAVNEWLDNGLSLLFWSDINSRD